MLGVSSVAGSLPSNRYTKNKTKSWIDCYLDQYLTFKLISGPALYKHLPVCSSVYTNSLNWLSYFVITRHPFLGFLVLKPSCQSAEMVQWVKALCPQACNLYVIPQTHIKVRGEDDLHEVALWPPLTHCGMCTHIYTHTCRYTETNKQFRIDSKVKSTFCSCSGHRIYSQHPHSGSQLWFQGIQCPLLNLGIP